MALVEIERRKAQQVQFALKVAKVDEETRTVKGIASQEIVDAHGQIVDYPTLKACLPGYKNNIREMHQPKAVGKAVAITCDDANQAVVVEAYVSKGAEDTWQKCLDGTLSAFSIGGVGDIVVGKNADTGQPETRIFMSALHEISVVDVPACPTATFEVVKMVDGVLTDVSLADQGVADTTAVTKTVAVRKSIWDGYDVERALMVLALLQELIGSEISDVVFGDDAGDPEASAQVDTLRLAAELIFDFAMSEFNGQFTALDARMAAIGKLADAPRAAIEKALAALVEKKSTGVARVDKALAQKLHENCVVLGASCGAPMEKTIDTPAATLAATETPAVAPVVEQTTEAPPAVEKVDAVATAVQSNEQIANLVKAAIAEANAPLVKQLEEQKATSDATIAKLEERLAKVEAEPAPGGPVKQAVPGQPVDKTLAGQPATHNPDDVAKAVQALVDVSANLTPEQRKSAAQSAIAASLFAPNPVAR